MIGFLLRHDPLVPILVTNVFVGCATMVILVGLGGPAVSLIDEVLTGFSFMLTLLSVAALVRPELLKQRFDEALLTLPVPPLSLGRARLLIVAGTSLAPLLIVWVSTSFWLQDDIALEVSRSFFAMIGPIAFSVALHHHLSKNRNSLDSKVWGPPVLTFFIGVTLTLVMRSVPVTSSITIAGFSFLAYGWATTPRWFAASSRLSWTKTTVATTGKSPVARKTPASPRRFNFASPIVFYSLLGNSQWPLLLAANTFLSVLMTYNLGPLLAFLPILAVNLHQFNLLSASVLARTAHLPLNRWHLAPVAVTSQLLLVVLGFLGTESLGFRRASNSYPYRIGLSAK